MKREVELTKNKIFSGMFWKFGERILAQIVSFIVSIVLARILLPEQYGIISLILIFITIADVFVSSGFGTALIQKKDATELDFNTNFICSLTVSVVIYLILFFLAPVISNFYKIPELSLVLRILSLRIIISSYNSIQHAYVSRHMLFKKFFFSTLFGTLFSGIIGIVLALNGFGVWALVVQYLTNTIIDSIVLSFSIRWKPKLQFSYQSARKMMGFGSRVLAADLIGTTFDQLRSLIIGRIYTSTDLAYYNKGKQIPSLLSDNISSTVMTVLFPAIADNNDSTAEVKKMIKKALKMMTYLVFSILIAVCVMSKPIITILLTDKWNNSIIYMQLLCISSAIAIIGSTSLQAIKAIGRGDLLLKLEFYKKPIYIILLLIGAYYSVIGIAISAVLYSLYSTIINARSLHKCIEYSFFEQVKDILPSIILSIIMGITMSLVMLINLNEYVTIILQVVIGLSVFVLISKIFKYEEFDYIVQFIKDKLGVKKKDAKKGKNY